MATLAMDESATSIVNSSPPPTAVPDNGSGPASPATSLTNSSPTTGNRNRSVSMNMHSSAPPSKKQRASDDENEAGSPSPAPAASPSSPFSSADAAASAAAISAASATPQETETDRQQDLQVQDDAEEPISTPAQPQMPVPVPPFNAGSDDDSDDSDANEEAFMSWLTDQKNAGMGAGQMLDALGLGVSEGVAIDDDELWEAMLSMGIRLIKPSVPRSREKLEHVNTLQDVVALLQSSKKIVVLAGAGISVSCGIPDFRSENGIYSRLGEYNLPNPQCMFDIEFFRSNPRPFFAFAKELFPKSSGFTFVPSRSHYFLKLLEEKGKLLRIYSQNIDMLEHAAGISHEHSVLCHGSFATATCLACKRTYPNDAIREEVLKQQVPMCKACNSPDGIIKPDIVFFGESLPRRFHDSIKSDEGEADLVLVMGSSLKVNPVRSIVGRFRKETPMILINREPVGRPHKFDVELLGYSDEIVQELCRLLEWEIPRPDPVLLGQSDLSHTPPPTLSSVAPLSFEFVPPSRHMFPGSKSTYVSSSDDDDGSSSDGEGGGEDAEEGADLDAEAVTFDIDDDGMSERKELPDEGNDAEGDQDELMGSGNELLGHSSFEEN